MASNNEETNSKSESSLPDSVLAYRDPLYWFRFSFLSCVRFDGFLVSSLIWCFANMAVQGRQVFQGGALRMVKGLLPFPPPHPPKHSLPFLRNFFFISISSIPGFDLCLDW